MNLQKDLREFIESLSLHDVRFVSDVTFAEAWDSREQGELDGLTVPFISREMLKRNKSATGRSQDLADLEKL